MSILIRQYIAILCTFLWCVTSLHAQPGDAQDDHTRGIYQWHKVMSEKLWLPEMSRYKKPFHFRFWHQGHVVDITYDGIDFKYRHFHYLYRINRNGRQDTIFDSYRLFNIDRAEQLEEIWEFILISGILEIPSDTLVNGFLVRHDPDDALIGFIDPITGEPNFFSSTTYRSDAAQFDGAVSGDGERITNDEFLRRQALVEQFISEFSALLGIQEVYNHYIRKSLELLGGCYVIDGVKGRNCYNNTLLSAGYYAAKGTPLGYYAGLTFNTLGIYTPNLYLGIFHRMDLQGHFCFKGHIAQFHNLTLKQKKYFAFAIYEYMSRRRPGNIDGSMQQLQRHCVLYSSKLGEEFGHWLLSRTSVAAGASYITGDQQSAGPLVAVSFNNLYGAFALIDKEVDYIISWDFSLPIRVSKRPWRFIQLGVDYERFRGENRFLFSAGILHW